MCLSNTWFEHKEHNTYKDLNNEMHQYDFFAITQEDLKMICDTKVVDFRTDSDHLAIITELRIAVNFNPKRRKFTDPPKPKINWRLLRTSEENYKDL